MRHHTETGKKSTFLYSVSDALFLWWIPVHIKFSLKILSLSVPISLCFMLCSCHLTVAAEVWSSACKSSQLSSYGKLSQVWVISESKTKVICHAYTLSEKDNRVKFAYWTTNDLHMFFVENFLSPILLFASLNFMNFFRYDGGFKNLLQVCQF